MSNDLSFDPRDPLFELPEGPEGSWARWPGRLSVQVFTTANAYALDASAATVERDGPTLSISGPTCQLGQQRTGPPGSLQLTVRASEEGHVLRLQLRAEHTESIKAAKLLFSGLPPSIEAQGWWHPMTARTEAAVPQPGRPVSWSYPSSWWPTRWAALGEDEALTLSVRDRSVRAARLYAHLPFYRNGEIVHELVLEEEAAAWDSTFEAPEVVLQRHETSATIAQDFEEHQRLLEKAFDLCPWETRADLPEWAQRIRLVLNLHGQHWTGYVFNTFDQMADVLDAVAAEVGGEHVIAYLPGWEGRYYFSYPWYRPGDDLGGEDGLRALVRRAHELGSKVMAMFGANGANAQRYPEWERAAFTNRTGRYVRFVNHPDWDTDRSGEDDQVFLNPGEPGFRRHLVDQIVAAVEEFDLDGVLLDTSGCWFNDPRFDLYDGYRQLVAEIHHRAPGVLIAGEGWWDGLLGLFPVNQSCTGVVGDLRLPQLLTCYARAVGHLGTPAPGSGSTGVFEQGATDPVVGAVSQGHLPAVSVVDTTLPGYRSLLLRACRQACTTDTDVAH